MSDSWVQRCGAQFGASDPNNQASPCWNYSKAAQQSWLNTQQQGTASERVFEASSDSFLAAMPPPVVPLPDTRTGTNATWAANEDLARFNAANTFYPYGPLYYQRMYDTATWTEIKTCENYVYRSFFDVERWIDSVNMCKGNARCVVNVSLNGMTATGPATAPGIARRQMKDADGYLYYDPTNANTRGRQMLSKGMVTQLEVDPFDDRYTLGELPKNMFYANTQSFMVPSLMAAFEASGKASHIQDLTNEINRGSTLYEVGDSHTAGSWFMSGNRAHQGFYDEWDFHNTMNQRTATVTHGEAREYRKRAEALRAQYDLLIDELKCQLFNATHPGGCNSNIPNAIGKVKPGEAQMWEGDPFATRQIFNSIDPQAFLSPPALQGQIGYGSRLEAGQYTLSQILATPLISSTAMIPATAHLPGMLQLGAQGLNAVGAGGSLAATKGEKSALTAASGTTTGTTSTGGGVIIVQPPPVVYIPGWTPSIDLNSNTPFGSLGWYLNVMWQYNPPPVDSSSPYPKLACTNRRLNIDTTYASQKVWMDACKLTNMLLEEWARLKQGKPSCFDRNGYACDWLPEDFVDRFVTKNIGYMAAAKEAEYRWCKRWTGGGQLTSTNPVLGVPAGNRISLNNIRVTLNSRQAQFEALLKKVPIKANDDFGTLRTDTQHIGDDTFGGGYSYSLGWHAKVLQRSAAGEICRMGGNASATFTADATLFGIDDISILDAKAAVSSNEGNSGQAYGDAKLYVVGYQIFDSDPDHTGQHINLTAGWSKVEMDGDKPELFSIPFQAGPVTITVTAGISYSYGVIAMFNAAPPTAGCDPSGSIFKVSSSFVPFADLGVWADADASLAGIVGVGLEVELTLVGLSLPLTATVKLGTDAYQNVQITFDAGLDLTLTTLKGEIDLYIKALFMKVASFTLVSWDGFRHTIPIFRTHETLPLFPLGPGTITPPTPGGDT